MYSEIFRTVFVHIPKTAGQSIERLFCARHGLAWAERAGPLLLGPVETRKPGPSFLAHLYAREYVALGHMTADTFTSAFKFTIVRNPYDRALSALRYREQRRGPVNVAKFLRYLGGDRRLRHTVPQSDFVLGADGAMLVDAVLRFEHLADDFAPISERLFGERIELPHSNRSKAPIGPDVFGAEARRRIYAVYERDFDMFGYTK